MIVEHFDTEDEAKARAGDLIGTLPGPNPVYGLQVTAAVVVPPVPGHPERRWHVEVSMNKIVAILRDPDDIPKEELDSAYQKVLEENAVLRRLNADLLQKMRGFRLILDDTPKGQVSSRPVVPPLDSVTYPQSRFPPD